MAERSTERKVAVITGTTRDVGEFTTYGLAQAGWDIYGVYRNEQHLEDQAAINHKIHGDYKTTIYTSRLDITDPNTAERVAENLSTYYQGKVDALVLNAAGGYGKTIEDARAINVDAQVRLVDRLLNNFTEGGVIVYNNSAAGHRYQTLQDVDLGDYDPVARTKNEVEQILRSRIPEFTERGIRLGVVVGNALEGTFVTRVLKRRNPNLVGEWQALADGGYFPTAMDMAAAVVNEVRNNNLASGHTEYVGIKPEYQLYPSRPAGLALVGAPPMMEGSVLSRAEVEDIIPHRWPFNFIGAIDEVEFGKFARGRLVDLSHPDINWRMGHFPQRQVVPGVITQEGLQQLGALTVLGMSEYRGRIAFLTGVEDMRYKAMVEPGEPVQLEATGMDLRTRGEAVFGKGHVKALNSAGKVAVEGNVSFAIPPTLAA